MSEVKWTNGEIHIDSAYIDGVTLRKYLSDNFDINANGFNTLGLFIAQVRLNTSEHNLTVKQNGKTRQLSDLIYEQECKAKMLGVEESSLFHFVTKQRYEFTVDKTDNNNVAISMGTDKLNRKAIKKIVEETKKKIGK